MFFGDGGFGGFDFEGMGGMPGMGGGGRRGKKKKEKVDNEQLYKCLGVEKTATASQIKKAYFKMARKHHPDKGGDAKTFQEMNAAYDVLKDKDMREAYDKYGMEGLKKGMGKSGGGPGGFEDIFSFFGNRGGGGGRSNQRKKKAKGMLKEMRVTLEEVYNGGLKKFKHERYRNCETCDGAGGEGVEECDTCGGKGRVVKMIQLGPGMYQQAIQQCSDCDGEGKTIKKKCRACDGEKIVKKQTTIEAPIEKGIPNEFDYVITGEAHEAPDVMAGDLHVRFVIAKHARFERKGADLYIDKSITLLEALTGFQFTFEHLDGRKIKVATQPGEVIVHTEMKMLRGHGMPFFQDEMSHGNLFVKFTVNFPKKGQLKPKQIKALKKVLPGPKHAAVDYKSGQFEVLDEYDPTDFNPKAAG